MQNSTILVVDDDPEICDLIVDVLAMANYQVESANDGFEATQLLRTKKFDLVVTDVNMPKINGYELVERMRQKGDQTPVIFLTARNEKPDVSKGLRAGADDYITKPFGIEEFTLRVAAILRRSSANLPKKSIISCGALSMDVEAHMVYVEDTQVALSATEFRLLQYLLENKNKVLTKNALLDEIWGLGFLDSATVVDTYISYLRKKIHINGFDGIKTVRGIGFQIVEPR